MFQKNGCSHFWHESLSNHCGACVQSAKKQGETWVKILWLGAVGDLFILTTLDGLIRATSLLARGEGWLEKGMHFGQQGAGNPSSPPL